MAAVAAVPTVLPGQRTSSTGRVLVLNASYEPINVCTVRRAAVLVLKQRAEMLEHSTSTLRAERMSMPRPVVIRLVTYVRIPRDAHRRKITRRAVFARDRWTCQYCGHERSSLTVDHVVPRSKGGGSGWENIVDLLCAVQPAQGRPAAAPGQHDPAPHAQRAQLHRVHPRRRSHHSQ